jgi:uncharacterized protein (TIGR02145 family)
MSSCVKDPTLPVLTTNEVIEITTNSATISGNVAEDGGAEITARGICWGTVTMPTLSDNFKPSGTGPGKFSCVLSELEPNTTYYVRAFAENRVGIAYGNEVTFKTGIAAPSVTTGQVTGVTNNSAICAGTVTYSGGAPVLEKGICWSQTPDPDLDDSHASVSAGTDTYTCTLTGLSSGSRYYARAYVKNEVGTGYGEQVVFNTKVTDIEGNMYGTVYIGNQVWMTENLRTTRLNDDTQIPNIIDNDEWISVSTSAYCWYNNDKTFKPTYGALYNWFTINSGKLCPAGWHVPSDTEFNSLEIALGMQADQSHVWGWRGTNHGFKMKNNTGWGENGNGNNSSGFSAIPGGYRFGADGTFVFQTTITYWWASTENDADRGWYRRLDSASDQVYRASTSKKGGKYVRCVKD